MEERAIKVEQKKSWMKEKTENVKKFVEAHMDEILLVGMFVGGSIVGLIIGFDAGNSYCEKKVMKAFEDFSDGKLEIPGIEIKKF